MSLEHVRYNNGLSLYVDHMPDAAVTAVNMFVPFGSVHERPGQEGSAHALEHCLFLKTPLYADNDILQLEAQLDGMECNAHTNYAYTAFETMGLTAEPAFRLLSQVLQQSEMPDDRVAHEMKAIRREAVTMLDDDEELHMLAHDNAMFGVPYGRSIMGYPDALRFSGEALRTIRDTRYALGAMTMVVVGAAKLDDAALLLEKYFDLSVGDAIAPSTLAIPNQKQGGVSGLVLPGTENLRISVAHPIPPTLFGKIANDRVLYSVAEEAISGAYFSRVRNDQGIAYDGSVSISDYNHPNAWYFGSSITTDPEHLSVATNTAREYLARGGSEYRDKTIAAALATGKLAVSRELSTVDDRMDAYMTQLARGSDPIRRELSLARISSVDTSDVRSAIDELATLAATQPCFEQRTGKKSAVKYRSLDTVIDLSSIA